MNNIEKVNDLGDIKIEKWDICKYAYMNCEEARDFEYFDKYCKNNGENCPLKLFELSNKLGLNID